MLADAGQPVGDGSLLIGFIFDEQNALVAGTRIEKFIQAGAVFATAKRTAGGCFGQLASHGREAGGRQTQVEAALMKVDFAQGDAHPVAGPEQVDGQGANPGGQL